MYRHEMGSFGSNGMNGMNGMNEEGSYSCILDVPETIRAAAPESVTTIWVKRECPRASVHLELLVKAPASDAPPSERTQPSYAIDPTPCGLPPADVDAPTVEAWSPVTVRTSSRPSSPPAPVSLPSEVAPRSAPTVRVAPRRSIAAWLPLPLLVAAFLATVGTTILMTRTAMGDSPRGALVEAYRQGTSR